MNLTQRARKANKIANNLTNEIESVNNIKILSKVYDNDMVSKFSYKGKNTKNIVNININDFKENKDSKNENDIFPALKGLNDNIEDKKDINSNTENTKNKKSKKKTRRKKGKREVIVKDLGEIGEDDYFLYKDNNKMRKERKETIIENVDKNVLDLNMDENK